MQINICTCGGKYHVVQTRREDDITRRVQICNDCRSVDQTVELKRSTYEALTGQGNAASAIASSLPAPSAADRKRGWAPGQGERVAAAQRAYEENTFGRALEPAERQAFIDNKSAVYDVSQFWEEPTGPFLEG